nr:hypothetical protein [Candidatus Mycoplasma haemohominis]
MLETSFLNSLDSSIFFKKGLENEFSGRFTWCLSISIFENRMYESTSYEIWEET